ncbi:MAG: acyl-CoA carboxylase subunit beta [Acidimicrobiales bacterium]
MPDRTVAETATARPDPLVADLHARAEKVRTEMGGTAKIERVHERGGRTIRERIDALVDPGSFRELGTFSRSKRAEDRHDTPCDGKIGGHARVGGAPVVVFGDDITVRQGSSSKVGMRKEDRLVEHAFRHGCPIVHIGETGGGRIPDIVGAEGISEVVPFPELAVRRHRVPMATAIVGKSFGGSSFLAALSDFTVQVRGSCLAVTSPRVFEVATGEIIGLEELGGVDVHARVTGQIDLGVDTEEEAWAAIQRWLSYLPPNAWTPPPRAEPSGSLEPDPGIGAIVPAERRRGYDVRRLLARLLDPGSFFELRPTIGRSLTAGLGRLDGWTVGVIASNPLFEAGAIDSFGCEKATRLLVLCDSFDIPVLFLQDVPGYLVGKHAEHERLLYKAMRFRQALTLCRCPTLTVITRKAFGLAFKSLNGSGVGADHLYAWPGAEIGFMDPDVGLNVIRPGVEGEERERLLAEIAEATSPYEAAGVMLLDEVIDPALTRRRLAEDLGRLAGRAPTPPGRRPLATWSHLLMTEPRPHQDPAPEESFDPVADLHERAGRIRRELGGAAAVARLHERGERTIREHIDGLVDPASFEEIGTFTRSMRVQDRASTPGDGKIGGLAAIDGRPVMVAGDDITVKRGSTSEVGGRRTDRLLQLAIGKGLPFVYFGQTGGARIPDIMGAEGFAELGSMTGFASRRHQVPLATAIVGQSFGASSFLSAMSDFTVQVRGSCLAVTSPRVVEVATGEVVTEDELGGADVHLTKTGQIDLAVDDDDAAYDAIRRFLSYLPPNAWTPPPRGEAAGPIDADPSITALVPRKRTRAYDMRRLVAKLVDRGETLELRPGMGRGLYTCFARIDGWPVAVLASNPMFSAGVLDPAACEKGIRMLVLCDAFQIPAVFLQDVPGFLVGRQVEHGRVLYRAIRFLEALMLCSAPTLTVIVRKAFGLAFQSLNGLRAHTDGLYAWPGAEIGFMDPEVGVNVLYGDRMDKDAKTRLAAEMREGTSAYEAAGIMNFDEIIDPATTRQVLARDLNLLAARHVPAPEDRPLAYWPTC